MVQWWVFRSLFGKLPLVIKLLMAIFIVVTIIGGLIHLLEPIRFPSLFDGIWWAIVTVSTVGYGDYAPKTMIGRTLGIVLIFIGVGIMTLLVSTVASAAFSFNQSARDGELAFLGKNHVIIIGWNERSKYAIEHVKLAQPHAEIVLIDETLSELPRGYKDLHFVKGNSSEDAVLKQANIGLASSVLITATQKGSEFSADARAILTTLAVKSQNPDVYTIVEILTKEQLENARRAGADECLESTILTGAALVTSLLHHHMSDVINQLLKFDQTKKLSFQSPSQLDIGKPFSQVLGSCYLKNQLLLGLKRKEQILLHPPAATIIENNDEFIVINRY
ncbi:potassium channel family protein [bacterium LRH843]|nr:potassium channel family protein [bacterium LRH843]